MQISMKMMAAVVPHPIPIPIFAPVASVGCAEVEAGELESVGLARVEDIVLVAEVGFEVLASVGVGTVVAVGLSCVLEVIGEKPAFQSMLSPVAVPKLTTSASLDASVKATVLDVLGHQHGFAVVTVAGPRFASQATHCSEVPLQYERPTQASPAASQYSIAAAGFVSYQSMRLSQDKMNDRSLDRCSRPDTSHQIGHCSMRSRTGTCLDSHSTRCDRS